MSKNILKAIEILHEELADYCSVAFDRLVFEAGKDLAYDVMSYLIEQLKEKGLLKPKAKWKVKGSVTNKVYPIYAYVIDDIMVIDDWYNGRIYIIEKEHLEELVKEHKELVLLKKLLKR